MDGEGAFFLYQLNVHTFNLEARSLNKAGGFNRRTDRRVEGCVRYGWIGGRREKLMGDASPDFLFDFFCYEVIVKQKKAKRCRHHYSGLAKMPFFLL